MALELTATEQDFAMLARGYALDLEAEKLKRIVVVRQYIELQAEHATCTADETKKATK